MKRIFLFVIIAGLTLTGFAQQIEVLNSVILPLAEGNFAAPLFSPDGMKLLITQSGYRGLWLYDLNKNTFDKLNDFQGAGYEPVFTQDGREIIFRVDDYSKMRKYSSLAAQTIADKNITYIVQNIRDLSTPRPLNAKTVVYRQNQAIQMYNPAEKTLSKSIDTDDVYAYIDNQKIIVNKNGKTAKLSPIGEGNYIWLSLSPQQDRMLFKRVGIGAYVTDLEGNVLAELGMANAPQWSPDGKWIVYMRDVDDGHKVTASEIWAVTCDGMKHIQLTKTTDLIEMYPIWSPDMQKVAFDTADGKIGYLEINISE